VPRHRFASLQLVSPRLASPRLARRAAPRLCLPARHETANTPGLKLRSHANAAARLLRLLGPRLSFTHANPTPFPPAPRSVPVSASPLSRLLSRRSSVSFFVTALSRENFAPSLRSLSSPHLNARAARRFPRGGEDFMASFGRDFLTRRP